ncbi:hypothetical protein KAR91_83610 [Candidatus Pacearchaeota archaeon]|nr:hypothetical protein [Candidatus Pacearchaeota archaeon]
MRIPIIGGSYKGRSVNINPQETINYYPILDQQGGKHIKALIGTPGLVEFSDIGSDVEIRGMIVRGNSLYAVAGTTLYSIDVEGVATALGGALGTTGGHVWMAHDGTNIMVVDPGVDGYTQAGAAGALTVIADADFPTPSTLTWQDGFFIISKEGTGQFFISASYDPTDWTATDYATAEANPDNLVAAFSNNLAVWLFGKETTEIWYNSGAAAFPFTRISGAFLTTGLAAAASLAGILGSLFWLNDRREVVMAKGHSPTSISTDQIVYHFEKFTTVSNAVSFCYTQEGHTFYVLTFPSEHETWVYDATINIWHQRASYPDLVSGKQDRHRANCYAYFAGKHLVGDYKNGKIYEMDLDTYMDDGEAIKRKRITQIISQDQKNLFFSNLEVEFEAGTGLVTGQGSDPQAMLRMSDDGGHTWGNEHWCNIGDIGEYAQRAIWRRLGRSRNRTFEISMSDPVKSVILGAYADLELGES